MLVTAAPVSTNIGVLTVHYNYDCIPASSTQQMAVLDFPRLGPFTPDFLALVYVNFTGLQALDYKTAAKLSQLLKNATDRRYESLATVLLSFLASYVPPSNGVMAQIEPEVGSFMSL